MSTPEDTTSGRSDAFWQKLREEMVDHQLIQRGINDARVLRAFLSVPRQAFVPENLREESYEDKPLPIGFSQTISQPFIVAYMVSLLELKGDETVLEIGTGSGYETAILASIVKKVYSIEIVPQLSKRAEAIFQELHYENVELKIGDGYEGWPAAAPFDAIVVSAAPKKVPQTLITQLKTGGKMIIPVGNFMQRLLVITNSEDKVEVSRKIPVRFVPMVRK